MKKLDFVRWDGISRVEERLNKVEQGINFSFSIGTSFNLTSWLLF